MALLTLEFPSQVLGRQRTVHLILPDSPPRDEDGRYPAVWLLHGRGESSDTWLQHACLADLAEKYGCALIMPAVENTRYANALEGDRNWDYLSEELPGYLETRFALARDRARRFAAGFSIGGYGALKFGIVLGQRFAAVGGISSALVLHYGNLFRAAADKPDRLAWLQQLYGSGPDFPHADDRLLEQTADRLARDQPVARIQLRCGSRDGSSYLNRQAVAAFAEPGLSIDYVETDGDHSRPYCESQLPFLFAFLFNRSNGDNP